MVKITTVRLLQSYTFFKLSRALFRSARARAGVANKLRAPDRMPDPGLIRAFPVRAFRIGISQVVPFCRRPAAKVFRAFARYRWHALFPPLPVLPQSYHKVSDDAADLYKSFGRFGEFHGSGVPIMYSISLNRYLLTWPSALWRTSSSPPGCTPVIVPRNCRRVRPSVYRCSCPSR